MKLVPIPSGEWQPVEPLNVKKEAVPVQSGQWQDMGVMQPETIRGFKGVNTLDKFSIKPEYASRVKNLMGGAVFPGMKLRPGTVKLEGLGTGNFAGRILGLASWKDQEIHVVANGTWGLWRGTAWINVTTGLSANAKWSFANFQGNFAQINLIGMNGVDPPKHWDGLSLTNLTGIPAGVTLNFVDQHDNRMYAAKENTVYFSALRKPQDWTTVDDAGSIVIETDDGEQIVGIKSGYRHLMIFKPSSLFELWGTGPHNYTLQQISRDIGLLNNRAVATVQGTPYWVDKNAIYSYGGAQPRRDFSMPVKGYIEGINPAHYDKVSAGASGNSFYVAIPYGTATEPDTILEYDTIFQTWYVWNDLSPVVFCDFNNALHMGDTAGNVLRLGGTTDRGAAINWEWVSPPLGSGSLAQRAVWYRMWYVVDITAGSTMNLYLSGQAEGENWTLVKSVTSANLQSGRVIIPLNTVANANWVRVRITGTGPIKISELDYQRREVPMF